MSPPEDDSAVTISDQSHVDTPQSPNAAQPQDDEQPPPPYSQLYQDEPWRDVQREEEVTAEETDVDVATNTAAESADQPAVAKTVAANDSDSEEVDEADLEDLKRRMSELAKGMKNLSDTMDGVLKWGASPDSSTTATSDTRVALAATRAAATALRNSPLMSAFVSRNQRAVSSSTTATTTANPTLVPSWPAPALSATTASTATTRYHPGESSNAKRTAQQEQPASSGSKRLCSNHSRSHNTKAAVQHAPEDLRSKKAAQHTHPSARATEEQQQQPVLPQHVRVSPSLWNFIPSSALYDLLRQAFPGYMQAEPNQFFLNRIIALCHTYLRTNEGYLPSNPSIYRLQSQAARIVFNTDVMHINDVKTTVLQHLRPPGAYSYHGQRDISTHSSIRGCYVKPIDMANHIPTFFKPKHYSPYRPVPPTLRIRRHSHLFMIHPDLVKMLSEVLQFDPQHQWTFCQIERHFEVYLEANAFYMLRFQNKNVLNLQGTTAETVFSMKEMHRLQIEEELRNHIVFLGDAHNSPRRCLACGADTYSEATKEMLDDCPRPV